jgi:hypothetical protein
MAEEHKVVREAKVGDGVLLASPMVFESLLLSGVAEDTSKSLHSKNE